MNLQVVWLRSIVTVVIVLTVGSANAELIEGFTQPYRTTRVSTVEVAVIRSIDVKEGKRIEVGDVVAILEHAVLDASLAVADKAIEATGRLASLRAELELRENHLRKLEELNQKGHARPDELERGRADLAAAQGNVLAAVEDLEIKRLERQRIQAQIERRVVRAPFAGVVSRINKEVGEHVAPNSPELLIIADIDTLLGVFAVPQRVARDLVPGSDVNVRIGVEAAVEAGVVETVSPLIDAESGTIRVTVRLDNTRGAYRSGQRCAIELEL